MINRIWKVTRLDFTATPPELKSERMEAVTIKVDDHGHLCFYDVDSHLVRVVREWNEVELLDE